MSLLRKLIEPKSRLAVAAAIGLMSQAGWSGETATPDRSAAVEISRINAEQIKADTKAYIEALNRRLAEDLAKSLENIESPRIEFVAAEIGSRG